MSGDLAAIKRIVEAFERSDWQEIDVRSGDLRVHLSTGGSATVAPPAVPVPSAGVSSDPVADADALPRPPVEDSAEPAVPVGAVLVTAPSPGIFWRSPEPGAPPFADVGDSVDPGSTLCIVEVMKLMNHIKAGLDGRVAAVYVDNGVAVTKDEPLFAIIPESPAS